MAATGDTAQDVVGLQTTIRGLRRERSLALSLAVLAFVLMVVDRAGTRVYAIALFDAKAGVFVEQAYLAERAQAEQVLAALKERARLAHPYYRTSPEAYAEANPGFRDRVVIRRVRRVTALTPPQPGAEAPVALAVATLAPLVQVEVDAFGVFDVQEAGGKRLLAALPDKAQAIQATETRLENVTRLVEAGLRGQGHLAEKPRFLQRVEIEPRRLPIAQVMTVEQAVAYLTNGDPKDSWHHLQTGETGAKGIARVAAKYGARVADLERWNAGRDLNTLRVGDRLIVRRPEPPLTVLTVERRSLRERVKRNGRIEVDKVTVEIRRHNGVELENLRREIERQPAG